jgi:hypothetical protein
MSEQIINFSVHNSIFEVIIISFSHLFLSFFDQELIYRNIKDEPFKIPNESYDDLMYTFFSPEKEGWLLKQGGK